MQKGNYAGGGRPSLWVKEPDGAQSVVVRCDPHRFFTSPYVGHKGRIGLRLDGRRVDWDEVHALVRPSDCLIAPKRLAARFSAKPATGRDIAKGDGQQRGPCKCQRNTYRRRSPCSG